VADIGYAMAAATPKWMGFAACLYFPWWSFAITSAIVACTVHQKPWKAFVTGFAAMFLLWGVLAYIKDVNNGHILSTKIANLLGLGDPILLLIITAIVGGLISGFASLTGSFGRRLANVSRE